MGQREGKKEKGRPPLLRARRVTHIHAWHTKKARGRAAVTKRFSELGMPPRGVAEGWGGRGSADRRPRGLVRRPASSQGQVTAQSFSGAPELSHGRQAIFQNREHTRTGAKSGGASELSHGRRAIFQHCEHTRTGTKSGRASDMADDRRGCILAPGDAGTTSHGRRSAGLHPRPRECRGQPHKAN